MKKGGREEERGEGGRKRGGREGESIKVWELCKTLLSLASQKKI